MSSNGIKHALAASLILEDGIGMYHRTIYHTLAKRLREPRRFIQVLAGPRQTGKTTMVRQIADETPVRSSMPQRTNQPFRAGHGSNNSGKQEGHWQRRPRARAGRSLCWTRSRR